MGIFHSLAGSIRVELTSADVMNTLQTINARQIPVWDLKTHGDLSVQFTVAHQFLNEIQDLAERNGEHLSILSYLGIYWTFRNAVRRPLVVLGCCLLAVLTLILPGRVLFVEVEGNERIPDNMILEAAREAGIVFGASRRTVRSEKIKNQLLDLLPQLQWAGINTSGCTAVVSVRERSFQDSEMHTYPVSNTIASCDGIITTCTITSGTSLCKEGQAVKKGQLLISGYTDCGGIVIAGPGKGEIFAQTRHEMTAVSPLEIAIRRQPVAKRTRFSLCIGKKRINFYKGSGIYGASCVKMVSQYYLTLPGDYVLPLSVIKTETIDYHTVNNRVDETETGRQLSAFLKSYVRNNGIARSITDTQESVGQRNGCLMLNGVYSCTEMIGRELSVQIGDFHDKTD